MRRALALTTMAAAMALGGTNITTHALTIPKGWGEKNDPEENETKAERDARRVREYVERPKVLTARDRAAIEKAEEKRERKAAKRRSQMSANRDKGDS